MFCSFSNNEITLQTYNERHPRKKRLINYYHMSKLFKVCFQHFIYETNFTLLLQLETRRMQRDAKKIGF